MDNKIKKIAKKRGLTIDFVETIVAGAESGFLKGWRDLVYNHKVQIWKSLETKTVPSDIYRLQGMLIGHKDAENRIDEVLEDYKDE